MFIDSFLLLVNKFSHTYNSHTALWPHTYIRMYSFILFIPYIISHSSLYCDIQYFAFILFRFSSRYRSFGVMVWAFQIAFLILLVLRVASKKHSTNEGTYSIVQDKDKDSTPHNVTRVLFDYYIILYYYILPLIHS